MGISAKNSFRFRLEYKIQRVVQRFRMIFIFMSYSGVLLSSFIKIVHSVVTITILYECVFGSLLNEFKIQRIRFVAD